jgi:hypothetical protein
MGGENMNSIIWVVAILSLTLPSEFQSWGTKTSRQPLPGPPGAMALEEFRSWKGKPGQELYLLYWEPRAPRPGGPMVSVNQWEETAAGQKVTVHETSQFLGGPRHVMVAHFSIKSPEAQAMIYGSGFSRAEFSSILAGIGVTTPAGEPSKFQPPCSVCAKPSATIELRNVAGEVRLMYSGPGGGSGSSGTPIEAKRIAAIRTAFVPPYSQAKVRAAGFFDDAGFCLPCGKFYCFTHWNVSTTGGGWCPSGHLKVLDPHASFD